MPTVDLSQLPKPAIINTPDFEVILNEIKTMMIGCFPEEQQPAVTAALALESEPLTIIAEVMAFREMLLRQRINEGVAACMLSHASGTDLDHLAANLNTQRLVITPATDTAPAVMENDTALRLRAQSAYEGLSVAGPSASYEYFARSASGQVADARAVSPSPAVVVVSILSTEGDGTASQELIQTVSNALNDERVRPVADRLTVQSAKIVKYRINARLFLYPGPESEPVILAARQSLDEWLTEQGHIGRDVARSAIMSALHVQGVQRVELEEPASNIAVDDSQFARCESIIVEMGGTNE
ncbi:TPA: baseplate J/gp47 family protein [Escherichia coli]